MKRLIFVLALSMFWGSLAHADEFQMKACTPVTTDGTQVFESIWKDGECFGNPKVTVRVTDFTLHLMCSVQAKTCVRFEEMDPTQKRHLEYLEHFRKVSGESQVRFASNADGGKSATWMMELHTGVNVLISHRNHAARSYDYVVGQGCVMLGSGTTLGCRPLEGTFTQARR